MNGSVKGLLGAIAFVLVVGGISGLLAEWWGWIRVFGFLRLVIPDGYEVFGHVVMIVLGIAVGLASEAAGRRKS